MLKLKLLPSYLLALLWIGFLWKFFRLYVWLRQNTYALVLEAIRQRYDSVYWMEVLDREFFSLERYHWLIQVMPFLGAGLILGLGLLLIKRCEVSELCIQFCRDLGSHFKQSLILIKCLSRYQQQILVALLILILGHRVYGWNTSMFGGDELFSFLHFVHQGPELTAMYYPVPNNHVGFNLLCSFLHMAIEDAYWVMRLIPWLSNLALLYILLVVGLRYWGFSNTMWMLLLVAFAMPSLIYVYYGRGYAPMATLHLLGTLALLAYLEKPKRFYRQIFLLSSILGLYLVPVFIFPLSSAVCWFIWESYRYMDWEEKKKWVLTGLQIIFFTLVLYSPVFFFSGVGAISANPYVVPWETAYFIQILPAGLAETLDYILYFPGKSYFLIPGLLLLTSWVLRDPSPENLPNRRWFRFLIVSAFILLLATLAMKRIAPYRTWTPLVSPVYMGVGLSIGFILHRIPKAIQFWTRWASLASVLLIFFGQQYHFYRAIYQDLAQDAILQEQVQALMKLQVRYGLILTMEEDPYELHMRWYMTREGIPWDKLRINGPYRAIPWAPQEFDFIIFWESRTLWPAWKDQYQWVFPGKKRDIYIHKKHLKQFQKSNAPVGNMKE